MSFKLFVRRKVEKQNRFANIIAPIFCLLIITGCSDMLDNFITKDQSDFSQYTEIIANDSEGGDRFGVSVAIDGDYAVVGANNDTIPGKLGRGAAYVFNRNQGESNDWEEVIKLFDSNAGRFDTFGDSVDISGDYAIVGKNVWSATYTGNVFIYER